MANTKSAAKRARQSLKRTAQNRQVLTSLKTQLKKTRVLIGGKNKDGSKAQFQGLSSALDKAVKTGQIHRNTAARHKSRFSKALAQLS